MATFNAYFDASGHPNATGQGAAMFVSGWVSTVEKWARFERLWLELLDQTGILLDEKGGVKPFHMTEFQAGKGIYKEVRQDDARYWAFKNSAMDLFKRNTNKAFSVGVVIPHLKRFYAEYEVPDGLPPRTPFGWCGIQAMELVYKWMANRLKAKKGRARPDDKIEIIFQHGDKDRGELLAAAKQRYRYPPTLTGNLAAVPFQACDYLAWEHRNWLSVRTVRPGAKPSHSNVLLARRLAFDSQVFADWITLTRHAEEHGWPKRTP